MEPDSNLAKKIESGDFIVTAEYLPRTGTDDSAVKTTAVSLKNGLTAVIVADNPFGTVMSSLAASAALICEDIEPVYLHAQVSAISFYEKLGFFSQGDIFYEASIPHREMFKKYAK